MHLIFTMDFSRKYNTYFISFCVYKAHNWPSIHLIDQHCNVCNSMFELSLLFSDTKGIYCENYVYQDGKCIGNQS